jgi:hypothetical protein
MVRAINKWVVSKIGMSFEARGLHFKERDILYFPWHVLKNEARCVAGVTW